MPEMSPFVPDPDEALVLPLRGADGETRRYSVRPVSAEWWWRFAALDALLQTDELDKLATAGANQKLDAGANADLALASELDVLGSAGFKSLVLGADNVRAMIDDGVSGPDMVRAVNTAFAWHASGGDSDVAERTWSGKARKSQSPKSSPGTAAASKTRSRGSSSGTSRSRGSSKTA